FIKKNWQTIKDVMKAVGIAIAAVGAVLVLTTVVALIPLATAFVAVTAAVAGFVAAMYISDKVMGKAQQWGAGLGKKLKGLKIVFVEAAKDMIMGLIEGLIGGLAKLQKTATLVGDAVKTGVKTALKIQSPSKVMEQLGKYTGEGFNIGIKASAGDGSAIASAAMNGAAAKSGGESKGGMVLNIHPNAISIQTGASAREVEDALEQNLTLMIERAAHAAGLG
ncbi:MAG TPA: hypothetical protein VMI75_15595, partial [Polyangiaceae bacterium]|nr:hypothetical protein [Polyangiaceae bacterium]